MAYAAIWACLLAPAVRAELLPIRQFTTLDGLAHNHINRIKVDAHGFLWICTDNGISRFDGQQFFTLTTADGLPHPDVTDIVQDQQGHFWLATDGGIVRFKLRSPGTIVRPSFQTFRSARHPGDHFDSVEFDSEGRLWAGGRLGLYEVVRGADHVAIQYRNEGLPHAPIPRILASRRGGLWIATAVGAFYRGEDGAITPVQPSTLGKNAYSQALLEDRSNRVWVGYRSGGFCLLKPEAINGRFDPEFCIQRLGTDIVEDARSILESADGRLWIASAHAGLCEFDRRNRRMQCYSQAEGLPEKRVLRIIQDPETNLWLGTGSSGVLRIARNGFARFDSSDGLLNGHQPWLAVSRTGQLVMATGNGALNSQFHALRDRKINTVWRAADDPAGRPFDSSHQGILEDSRGCWWVFSGEHLYRFPPGAQLDSLSEYGPRRFSQARHTFHRTIHEDGNGAIWISTVREREDLPQPKFLVLVLDNHADAFRPIPAIEQAMRRVVAAVGDWMWVSAMEHDRTGSLWLGIASPTAVYQKPITTLLRYRADGGLDEFTAADGLPAANVNDLHLARDGRLWLATYGGLASLDPGAGRPRFRTYGLAQGLASEEVWSVTEDDSGRIYAGTAKGVDRLDPATGRVHHFTSADGLGQGRILAAERTPDGRLWFASENELARLDPAPSELPTPRAFLVSPSGPFDLAYNHSYFEAQFSSPSYGVSPPMFQYRLSGQDEQWGPPVREGTVRYAGMSPGAYSIEARAINHEGKVSEPVSLQFRVLPPFWRTWWFLALLGAAAAAALYAAYRFRVEQLLEVERVRMRISSDLHDDIGSTLAQVSTLSELARRSLNGSHPAAVEHIDKIAEVSGEAAAAMSDIVWAIHPRNDQIGNLVQRMRRFASDILSPRNIGFSFDLPNGAGGLSLPPEIRRDLLLIFKESVHNAARHSGCGTVRAALEIEQARARLTVEDDGTGIGPVRDGELGGNGLLNMRARAAQLGGSLELLPGSDGRGTKVVASLPLLRVRIEE